jgi:acyl transferase domain-containing protein
MTMKTVFMFSGQGSQYFQMGRELFERNETFRSWMTRLDRLFRELSGNSVVETIYSVQRDKSMSFDRTLLTHPAIFMTEFALAQSLIEAGVKPDVTLGASMGSFAAAAVSGMVSAEEAFSAVVRQAMALEAHCEPGGMMAVLGDPNRHLRELASVEGELAAINYSLHFVIAFRRARLEEIESQLKQRELVYQRLPVSLPFHSRWIEGAQAPFEVFMRSIHYATGTLPLMCCDQASEIIELPEGYFWSVVRNPIRFQETIGRLERSGPHRYIDVGPAGTLAAFLKYGLPATSRSKPQVIMTPYGRDLQNFCALTAMVG